MAGGDARASGARDGGDARGASADRCGGEAGPVGRGPRDGGVRGRGARRGTTARVGGDGARVAPSGPGPRYGERGRRAAGAGARRHERHEADPVLRRAPAGGPGRMSPGGVRAGATRRVRGGAAGPRFAGGGRGGARPHPRVRHRRPGGSRRHGRRGEQRGGDHEPQRDRSDGGSHALRTSGSRGRGSRRSRDRTDPFAPAMPGPLGVATSIGASGPPGITRVSVPCRGVANPSGASLPPAPTRPGRASPPRASRPRTREPLVPETHALARMLDFHQVLLVCPHPARHPREAFPPVSQGDRCTAGQPARRQVRP